MVYLTSWIFVYSNILLPTYVAFVKVKNLIFSVQRSSWTTPHWAPRSSNHLEWQSPQKKKKMRRIKEHLGMRNKSEWPTSYSHAGDRFCSKMKRLPTRANLFLNLLQTHTAASKHAAQQKPWHIPHMVRLTFGNRQTSPGVNVWHLHLLVHIHRAQSSTGG